MIQQPHSYYYYLGKSYPLYVTVDTSTTKITIQWNGKAFMCTSPEAGEIDFTDALKSFYVKEIRKLIGQRLKLYQTHFKVKYRSFTIENSCTKWGSCSSERYLTFNWKLIIFPLTVIDYIVVHELCHLIHMNHGRSFWRLVGKFYPEYKEAMAILGTEKTREI